MGGADDARKTYTYLRLAMIALVVLLGSSVVIEIVAAGGSCWRTSISSYYFTPVRGVFVGGLVAIGVSLVAMKGNTPRQDILLNIAGILAPVIAFVPIQDPHECSSAAPGVSDAAPNIANNVGALLVVGVLAMLTVIVLARNAAGQGRLDRDSVLGIALVALVAVVGAAFFFFARPTFERWAHYGAAIPLFVILIAVMLTDALSYRRTKQDQGVGTPAPYRNPYLMLAVLLAVSVPLMLVVKWVLGWDHATLWIEIDVIVLFAAFWVVQTRELWPEETGLRDDPQGTRNVSPAASTPAGR